MKSVVLFALLFTVSLCPVGVSSAREAANKDMIVLLHGIAKSNKSMRSVETVLRREGYETLSLTYPSQKHDLDGLADYLRKKHLTEAFWEDAGTVHFVTHSMGGLVARRYLDKYKADIPSEKLGRVVMLAPPNGGSEVSDLIHGLWPYQWYYGPAGAELTTAAQADNQAKPYYDLGIIAGTKKWPYFVAAFVTPGKSDGRVTVARTKLEGMKDHISVNATHTFIMNKPVVHRHIIEFLKEGKFGHEK